MKILIKILLWITGVILVLLLLVVMFISPITEYVIEKNSKKWTGRQILMDKLGINVFNGKVTISGLRVYEPDDRAIFIRVGGLVADADLGQLLKGIYRIEQLHIADPDIRIVQQGDHFNYDDILKKFSPDTVSKPAAPSEPVRWSLEDVLVSDGKVTYINNDFALNARILKIGIGMKSFAWNDSIVKAGYSFLLATGGGFSGDLDLNLNSLDYRHRFRIDHFNLAVLYPYLTPYLRISGFNGYFSASLNTKGNLDSTNNLAVSGNLEIGNLSIPDETGKEVAGINLFSIRIDSLDILKNIWQFGNILADEPYFRFELYNEETNLSRLVIMEPGTQGADSSQSGIVASEAYNPFILMSDYVKALAEDLIITNYKVRRFSITNGEIIYKDHTLQEEFELALSHFSLDILQINPARGRATAEFSTQINKNGFMYADISINPLDFMDFSIKYELKNLAVVDYNPYSIFHVAYPFKRGRLNYTGTVTVKNHQIVMDNNLNVEKIYLGKKVNTKTAMDVPLKLAIAILRDKDGNIKLVVPVEGDLNDPKFNVWKVVWQIVKNLFVKAATAPYNLLASAFGGSEDEFKEVQFDFMQSALNEKQTARLQKICKVLEEKPELVLTCTQVIDTARELEYLAYFEARKHFYFEMLKKTPVPDSLAEEDKKVILALDNTDLAFNAWLDRKLGLENPALVSRLEKCERLIGIQELMTAQQERMARRNQYMENWFTVQMRIPASRIKIATNHDPRQIPEDRIPRYILTFGVEE